MELTWYGRTCVRLRGRDAVVVHDAYGAVVGPTGRGITADIVTYSHADDAPVPRAKGRTSRDGKTVLPTSVEDAFVLDGPGEYEVKNVLLTGVRTDRDEARGRERGHNVAFVTELDGIHTIHLGDVGQLLTEEKLADVGRVDVACIPIGGSLTATRAAEVIAQLDPRIVVVDAGLPRRGRMRGSRRDVLPRDGRHGRPDPTATVDHARQPARRGDDGPARGARQELGASLGPRGGLRAGPDLARDPQEVLAEDPAHDRVGVARPEHQLGQLRELLGLRIPVQARAVALARRPELRVPPQQRVDVVAGDRERVVQADPRVLGPDQIAPRSRSAGRSTRSARRGRP